MEKTALVIMAAGIGSRFGGGIKQLAQVGPSGEIIMDYSIHDALEAGFNKVVFILKRTLRRLLAIEFQKLLRSSMPIRNLMTSQKSLRGNGIERSLGEQVRPFLQQKMSFMSHLSLSTQTTTMARSAL